MLLLLKTIFIRTLNLFTTRAWRIRFGEFITNHARGQGNGDPSTNGEYWLTSLVKRHIQNRQAIVIDVGANCGDWTVNFASGMSRNLNIISFEPVPNTYNLLKECLANITFSPAVRLINMALSDSSGITSMYIDSETPTAGSNSLIKRRGLAFRFSQREIDEIKLITGDEFCKESNIKHIDFIKIDTEGHEYSVLKGFSEMLSKRQIDIIQFEYGGTWLDSKIYLADVFDLLVPFGYVIARLHPNFIEPFSFYDQREESFVYSNYVAVREELLPLFKKV